MGDFIPIARGLVVDTVSRGQSPPMGLSMAFFLVEGRRDERGSGAPWGWVVVRSGEERVIKERVCRLVLTAFLVDNLRSKVAFLPGSFSLKIWTLRLVLLVCV